MLSTLALLALLAAPVTPTTAKPPATTRTAPVAAATTKPGAARPVQLASVARANADAKRLAGAKALRTEIAGMKARDAARTKAGKAKRGPK